MTLWRMLLSLLAQSWAGSAAFRDVRAWVVIILCAGGVSLFDPVMAKTVLQWVLLFGVFAGITVIVSRHVLPQVDLGAQIRAAYAGNVGAGLVVLGLLIFMSALILAVVLWAKA